MVTGETQPDLLAIPDEIDSWPFSSRTKNVLRNNGLRTVDSMKSLSLEQLKAIPSLGPKGIVEIRDYFHAKYGIIFKSQVVKKKKLADAGHAKQVVTHFLKDKPINWANQLLIADKLLKRYGLELLLGVKPNPEVYSLLWYNSDYGHKYLAEYFPSEVIKTEPEPVPVIEQGEPVEFVPVISNKPKSLKDFLKL